jgi:succinate dehydrogenase / fumarate reductase cytochrome b subunit
MSTIKTALGGYVGYRGREGHWAFLLHRFTGLGTLLFLIVHILDTSTVYFAPALYEEVMNIYRSTLFGLGEVALVFCVFYHGINGLRIGIVDLFAPRGWIIAMERRATLWTFIATMVLWVPSALYMLRKLLMHNYGLFGG